MGFGVSMPSKAEIHLLPNFNGAAIRREDTTLPQSPGRTGRKILILTFCCRQDGTTVQKYIINSISHSLRNHLNQLNLLYL